MKPMQNQSSSTLNLLVTIGFAMLAVEGLLKRYVEELLATGGAFWLGPVPFLFFPSEMFSIFVLIPILGATLIKHGSWLASKGWFLLVVVLCVYGVLHLWYDSEYSSENVPTSTMISEYKGALARMALIPLFYVAAARTSPVRLMRMVASVGLFIAIGSILLSVLVLVGAIPQGGTYSPNFTGCQILLLPAAASFWTCIVNPSAGKWLATVLILMGVLLPLEKPAISSAAIQLLLIVLLLLLLPFLRARISKSLKFGRSALAAVAVLGIVGLLFAIALLANDGAGLRYLEQRFLKTEVAESKRDVSNGRFEIWQWGLDQWSQSPFVGKGFGHEFIGKTSSGESIRIPVHQEFLNILYKLGLIGFLPYCLILCIAVRRCLQSARIAEPEQACVQLAGLTWIVVMLLSNCVAHTTEVQSMGLVFWPTVGLLLGWSDKALASQGVITTVGSTHIVRTSVTHEQDHGIPLPSDSGTRRSRIQDGTFLAARPA